MFIGEVEAIDRLQGNQIVSVEVAHREGLWHPAVHVYATDGESVAQRPVYNDPRPNGGSRTVWDMSVLTADVMAGETPEQAVWRTASEVGLELQELRALDAPTFTEVWQTDEGFPFPHRTVDYNFVANRSSVPEEDGIRYYPIANLLNDTCYSRGHEASFWHVHRGPRNQQIYSNILAILAGYGKA